jgi:hypothetical protein
MNHAQQMERSKKTATVSGTQFRKRKFPDAAIQESQAPQIKRLKIVKPSIADTGKHGDNSSLSTKPIHPPANAIVSAKTMSKLNAFRYSVAQPEDCQMQLSKICDEDTLKYQEKQDDERFATKFKYIIKDHSSRLIQSGREEMAGTQRIEPTDIYKGPATEDETADQDAPQPQWRYKIKDHSSRLIEAGKKELAVSAKKAGLAFLEDQADIKVTDINSAEVNDTMDNFDDLDDSIFDDLSLDGFDFEGGTPANTTGATEMDDMYDSIFEQIIADDDGHFQEAPSSAQPETNCFSSDTVSSPGKPGLMLPPKLPSSVSPPKDVSNISGHRKVAQPNTPISPFIRPPGAVLVTSPSPIPILHSIARVVTCFRLAEMFRETSSPSPPSAIELFATVKASARNRDSTSQSFTLADLFFPQRPPYVHGIYSKCSESELFDDDSRPFLKAGPGGKTILARAIVRPKPKSGKQLLWNSKNGFHASEETSTAMEVEILSIYVCPWEDIEYTKGIVMPEKEVSIKQDGGKEVFYKPEKKRKFAPLKPGGGECGFTG